MSEKMTLPEPTEAEFKQPSAGQHIGLLYRIIDLGTQTGEYQGQVTHKRQVYFGWELQDEDVTFEKDGKEVTLPFGAGMFYTWSMSEKANLRKHLESWRGKELTRDDIKKFHMEDLLGKCFMLSLIENQKGKIKVESVTGVPKILEEKLKNPVNELQLFNLNNFSQKVFDELPKGFQDMIKKSPEYHALDRNIKEAEKEKAPDDLDDEIPFG